MMTNEEIRKLRKKGSHVLCQYDSSGNLLAYGTEKEYGIHYHDVVNGNGYYDDLGNYCQYEVAKWIE